MNTDHPIRLLLGGLSLALLLVASTWIGNRWLAESTDEESDALLAGSADPADFDIGPRRCQPDEDETRAVIALTNRAGERSRFGVTVRFTTERGFTLDAVSATSPGLVPDETAKVVVRTSAAGTGLPDTRCELVAVDDRSTARSTPVARHLP